MAASSQGPKKVTQPTLQVMDLLLSQPHRAEWFGMDICRQTRLGSGTVTQILFRLNDWGWVEARWEDAAEAHAQGRPRRRFYRLSALGEHEASALIRQRLNPLIDVQRQ